MSEQGKQDQTEAKPASMTEMWKKMPDSTAFGMFAGGLVAAIGFGMVDAYIYSTTGKAPSEILGPAVLGMGMMAIGLVKMTESAVKEFKESREALKKNKN